MYSWKNDRNLTPEEVRKIISDNGLVEYGLGKRPVSEEISLALDAAKDSGSVPGVVCGLYNLDTRGVLLPLLRNDPEKILKGISYAAIAVETDQAFLHIPDQADDLADAVSELCAEYNVTLERGIADVRKRAGCLALHITAAADIADLFEDEYKPGVYVSVDGGAPFKADESTPVSELTDISSAKAVVCGMRLLSLEEAEKPVGEYVPEDGFIHAVGAKECIMQTVSAQLNASGAQSCGKCVFCREGLIQLQFMHKEMTSGRGKQEHLELIKEIGESMCVSTPCSMGQQSALIALTALDKYESVYKEHIKKKCDVCFSKEAIYIDPKLCQGCTDCADVCPKDCIEGKAKYIHMIDDFDCDLCGKCIEACEYDAIVRTTGKLPKLPNRLTKVGKFKR